MLPKPAKLRINRQNDNDIFIKFDGLIILVDKLTNYF